MKKFITTITAIILALTLVIPTEQAFAAEIGQAAESSANSFRYKNGQNCAVEEVPELKNMRGSTSVAWSEVDGKFYSSNGKVIEGAIAKGIDVSYWNSEHKDINWNKVKATDIDFAILRCGFGNNEPKYDDSTFMYNATECERLGIPYGIYLYSYANDVSDAKSEAAHVLRNIEELKAELKRKNLAMDDFKYPIYYDVEDKSTLTGKNTEQNAAKITKYAETFCSIIEKKGYDVGVYANLNWWNTYLTSDSLDKYEKWVAQYNSKCTYKKEYRIWQSTSSGKVNGIYTKFTTVDINFLLDLNDGKYGSSGEIAKEKSGWHTTSAGKKYYINSSGNRVTGYKKIGDYYYLFNSSGIMRTGTVKSDDKQYVLGSSGKSTLYTAKTKDVLNYRTGPGTSYKVKGTYKKGKTISVIREKSGWGKTRDGYWVKLKYTKKVTTYPKFISFKVKTTDDLNYRTGPGTSYKKKGMYKKGKTLTIVNKKNGWGKTSTGYWVKLEYTKRI